MIYEVFGRHACWGQSVQKGPTAAPGQSYSSNIRIYIFIYIYIYIYIIPKYM
jgi:hypothetical protein